jgi:hypothetical protein
LIKERKFADLSNHEVERLYRLAALLTTSASTTGASPEGIAINPTAVAFTWQTAAAAQATNGLSPYCIGFDGSSTTTVPSTSG